MLRQGKGTAVRLGAVVITLGLASLAAGCGGDDDSTSPASSAAPASASAPASATAETAAADTAAADTAAATDAAAESEPASTAETVAVDTTRIAGFELADYIKEHVANGDRLKFTYITNDLSISYTESQRVGVQKASEDLGVDAELVGPPTGAAQDQVNLVQTLIAQKKVDGIAVAAVNVDSLKPVIQQAFDAGIPFVSVFTDQPSSKQLAFVGADNEGFGKYEGELLADQLAGKSGKVVAISVDTAAGWSTARMDGLKAGLGKNPGLEMVGPINTGVEPAQMFNAIQNAMKANPDALAIASVDCCSITGAARWAETSGNAGKVVVIGTDALKTTLASIDKGTVAFAISQDPVGQVGTAIKQLRDFVVDGVPPQTVIMPPLVITKDNAGTVTPEG